VVREEGKKKRKIRFPDEILPDLGICAEDVIEFGHEEAECQVGVAELQQLGPKLGAGKGNSKGMGKGTKGSSKGKGHKGQGLLPSTITNGLTMSTTDLSLPTTDKDDYNSRCLRLSPGQFSVFHEKSIPHMRKQGKYSNLFVYPDAKLGPVVSHYGHSPQNGHSQLVVRGSNSGEGGVPRVMSREECLRVMGMNWREFEDMELKWMEPASAVSSVTPYQKGKGKRTGKGSECATPKPVQPAQSPAVTHPTGPIHSVSKHMNPLMKKKAAYKVIGNAVVPPVIAWLAEKVVLRAGGFIEKVKRHNGEKVKDGKDSESGKECRRTESESAEGVRERESAGGRSRIHGGESETKDLPAYLRLALQAVSEEAAERLVRGWRS